MSDNVQPLRRKMIHSDGEAIVRYHEACDLIRRLVAAWEREGWQEDGETLDSVMDHAGDWLAHEELEREVFGVAAVPAVKSATGRMTPDLTGMAHVCEYQARIRPLGRTAP